MIESLRVLMACRKTAVSARRVALQMIHNTIVCAPDGLRDQLRSLTRMQLVRTVAAWRPDLTAYRDLDSAYRIAFKSLARRYLELHDEIADLDVIIAAIVDELAPNLVARNSIGHIGAAQLLLTAGDNPERLRSEASFASLCGVSPVPASSGKTIRHRLNRGGDRAANSALYIIAIGRLRTDQRTKDYVARRTRRRAFQARRHSRPEALSRQRGLHAYHAAAKGNTQRESPLDKQKGVRGSQYVSIKYTERLAEAGIEPSVGSVGDSYDNALAETINGLYKAEVIHRRGPWRSFEAVEFATLEWVDWFNNRRLLQPIGNIPPAEAEERYYAMTEQPAMAA